MKSVSFLILIFFFGLNAKSEALRTFSVVKTVNIEDGKKAIGILQTVSTEKFDSEFRTFLKIKKDPSNSQIAVTIERVSATSLEGVPSQIVIIETRTELKDPSPSTQPPSFGFRKFVVAKPKVGKADIFYDSSFFSALPGTPTLDITVYKSFNVPGSHILILDEHVGIEASAHFEGAEKELWHFYDSGKKFSEILNLEKFYQMKQPPPQKLIGWKIGKHSFEISLQDCMTTPCTEIPWTHTRFSGKNFETLVVEKGMIRWRAGKLDIEKERVNIEPQSDKK